VRTTKRKTVNEENSGAESNQGISILDVLRVILKRCEDSGDRLGYPGEGGERAFRGWLVTDLIESVLGWPKDKVVVGERFDILLQDAEAFPVATIETKTPGHKASKKEREDFENRLSGYGTLRTAYLTNGEQWERLDIISPTGELEVRERFELQLQSATAEEAEAFFAPLTADRFFSGAPRLARHAVSATHPHILEALAADLDQTIADLALFFESFFAGLRDRRAATQTRAITLSLFNRWCEESLIVSPRHAATGLVERWRKQDLSERDLVDAVMEFGLARRDALTVSDHLATMSARARRDIEAVADVLWPAYTSSVKKLCVQTAHVLLARALLYRIGEDQDLFPRLLSGEEMEKSLAAMPSTVVDAPGVAADLLSHVQVSMQRFLPAVYLLGEFDWWQVKPDQRALLTGHERTWLGGMDKELERAKQRCLRMLNGYDFGRVDVDVWRNVYQHYLPADERQRLGGFYTPDELVNLVFDLAEFTPEKEGLCHLSFIDPACGSGAFVTTALARLLKHLDQRLSCHAELNKRGLPEWKRAEAILNIAARNLHAVDLHPFAAFLTTLNALFLVMPLYVKARAKNQDFSLDLQIFSSDTLEKHDEEMLEPDLFTRLNSRVQLTEDSFRRYQQMLNVRFDRVFGNPPWGGVLKGPLAPVYDTLKKQRFTREYPAAAKGKYDAYGLFMERALQILKPGGRWGLLTQGTFIDKEWAAGLREMIATKTQLRFIIDLNPFGQLFFDAMNIPCLTVAEASPDGGEKDECIAVLSTKPEDFKGLSKEERRKHVVATIREAIEEVSDGSKSAAVGFARAARVPLKRLRETAKDRWNLAALSAKTKTPRSWLTAADVFEPSQGVTVGGEGCLDLFLMSKEEARRLKLESELVHPIIKGRETTRWKTPRAQNVILYPYDVSQQGDGVSAFMLDIASVKDERTRKALQSLGIADGIDFDRQIDEREQEIARRKGINRSTVQELLQHRMMLDLVAYPQVAAYLVKYYEQLEGRIFKKRNIRTFNRMWYEFIWPRNPRIMLAKSKIITPRLSKEVRFALDTQRIIPQDSCICMTPTPKTERGYRNLRHQLTNTLGWSATLADVLKYCLGFLNSNYAQDCLVTGHLPTPKGFFAISDKYLHEIPIPPPSDKKSTAAILDLVTRLTKSEDETEIANLESKLGKIVNAALKT
jgi:hypothetical protein